MLGNEPILIFDFDGTLYQGEEIYHSFLTKILQEIGRSDLDTVAWNAALEIYAGRHSCRIGEHIVIPGEANELADSASTPTEYASFLSTLRSYSDGERFNRAGHRIGDCWGVVFAVTRPLVADYGPYQRAFRRMREELIAAPMPLEVDPRLQELFKELRFSSYLILLSNSSGGDGDSLLDYLGIRELFHEIRFDAGKPKGMVDLIEELIEKQQALPTQILSIGDHPWNDLYPAADRECNTLLVSPFQELNDPRWTHRAQDTGELITLLKEMLRAGAA